MHAQAVPTHARRRCSSEPEALLREMSQPFESTSQMQPLPRRSLEYLAPEQKLLCARVLKLTPDELELPSDLPGWSIFDLAVHITRVCDSILLVVQRASTGDRTPAFGAAARPREQAIRAMSPLGWVDLQRNARTELTRLVAGMTDAQLDEFNFPHPGDGSMRNCAHRRQRALLLSPKTCWQVRGTSEGTVLLRIRSTEYPQAAIRADAGWRWRSMGGCGWMSRRLTSRVHQIRRISSRRCSGRGPSQHSLVSELNGPCVGRSVSVRNHARNRCNDGRQPALPT
jgi:uncharacterized protein (TIGR03083 family)